MLIVLDSLGVMFRTRDDRSGCLAKFVTDQGSERAITERSRFDEHYFACTRGQQSTADFWRWCGLDPRGLDELYVANFVTTPGLRAFVGTMASDGHQVACLTNDAGPWSHALRRHHELMSVEPWVVSSAVGVRKPDPRIFEALRLATGGSIVGAVFVDDTAKNLDAASNLGLHTVHYRGDSTTHAVASTWRDVEDVVAGLRH